MTASLAPSPKFTPLINGQIVPGAKLFTYGAGGSTKAITWKDEGKVAANNNPVILDSAGQADVWLDGAYKLVLAPPTDSDPPASPYWTVDNVVKYGEIDWDGLTATIPQINACDTSAKFTGNSNYTVLVSDRGKTICANNSTVSINIFLPNPTTIENGFIIRFKKTDLGIFTATLDAGATYTIEGFYRYYTLIPANNTLWLLWDGIRWNIIQEGFRKGYTLFSASGSVEPYMNNQIMECSPGASDITLTLPLFATVGFGFSVAIKIYASGGGNVIIDPGAGNTIDGDSVYTMSTLNECITIWIDNATTWFIRSSHNPALYTPVGFIGMFGVADAVAGWLDCDGTAVSRTTYDKLFAKIGTTWGVGDGATTFNVPNFADRSPVGNGTTVGVPGTYFGAAQTTLMVPNLPAHLHTVNVKNNPTDTHGNGEIKNIANGYANIDTTNGFLPSDSGVVCQSDPFDRWHPVASCNFKIKF